MESVTIDKAKLSEADLEELEVWCSAEASHYDCEDCWYSCATITCDEHRKSETCDCGADDENEMRRKLHRLLAMARGKEEQEPCAWRWKENDSPDWSYSVTAPTHSDAQQIEPLYPMPWARAKAAQDMVLVSANFLKSATCPNECQGGMFINTGPDPLYEQCEWCWTRGQYLEGKLPYPAARKAEE